MCKAAKASKQPWYVHRKAKGEPLWLAGLYDRQHEGAELETFTLITRDVETPYSGMLPSPSP